MLIHLVADYGKDDLAFAEVAQALRRELPFQATEIIATPVPAFDTLSTGFVVAQLAREEFPERIIYHNTAPRKDDLQARENNDGEPLAVSRKGDLLIIGPNAGYAFSFLESPVYSVDCATDGSQFRSRDVFPAALARLLQDDSIIGKRLDTPPVPDNTILYIDGYGNIKTSIGKEALKKEAVEVTINGDQETAHLKGSAFAGRENVLVLTPGSSGGEKPYLELFLRGGSAAKLFNNPKAGDAIILG